MCIRDRASTDAGRGPPQVGREYRPARPAYGGLNQGGPAPELRTPRALLWPVSYTHLRAHETSAHL
eukprot:12884038-Alexandrium_andersonii.AAC.1